MCVPWQDGLKTAARIHGLPALHLYLGILHPEEVEAQIRKSSRLETDWDTLEKAVMRVNFRKDTTKGMAVSKQKL